MRRKKERQPNFVMSLKRRHSRLSKSEAIRGKASKPKPNFVMPLEKRQSRLPKKRDSQREIQLAEAERAARG